MPSILTPALKAMLVALAVAVVLVPHAHGQSEPPRGAPFGVPSGTIGKAQTAPSAGATASMTERLWLGIVETQRQLTAAMTGAVKRLKASGSASAAALLAFVSFVYGVLHAAGPGHGKFVITSYALANERTVRRGILLSFMAAIIQAIMAIAVVGTLAVMLKTTSLEIRATEAWLETASWGLIAVLGGWLLLRQIMALRLAGTHQRDGHGHSLGAAGHQHDADCSHAHLPPPGLLASNWSWRQAWSLAMSIGIRPCTGAILVLLFALSIGMFWAGVLATFAMAVGTALAVSMLTAIAVGSRELAGRIAGRESRWASRIEQIAGIAGATLVLAMGATFFIASLAAPAPL
jgi:ABC-type nickel/cobalt efflux system permease component RcnA